MTVNLPLMQHARRASILVVDDEPDVADLGRQRFRREAREGTYVMHFAASGAEALDRLAGEIQPTLIAVLSDINMPGMDGLELLAEIKQRFPELPVMPAKQSNSRSQKQPGSARISSANAAY